MNRIRNRGRRGLATVELAIGLPVVLILIFGSIETCSMVYVRQALSASAYEAARIAIRADGSSAAAEAQGINVLTAHGIDTAEFVFSPADVSAVDRGEQISVTASAPADSHSVIPLDYFAGMMLTTTTVMIKE